MSIEKKKKFNTNINTTVLISLIFLVSGLAGLIFSLYQNGNSKTQPSDIQITQNLHSPLSFVQQLTNDPQAGRKIFMEFCTNCHGKQPVIDLNAPRIDNKKAWHVLEKLGIETLLNITANGIGAMPARGGCFECSDEQLRQTLQYILKESK
jgi:cytochrome c5